ncbi:MAG: hypothetical protein CL878_12990 [Dehalococcoidia bacterium]|nr:hypothetical protein [Dehalococcoidia bacterium]
MRHLLATCLAVLLGLLTFLAAPATAPVSAATTGPRISEVLAANSRTVPDAQGHYHDWLELHNPTASPLSLAGYTLTDNPIQPGKWPLPATTLAPGAFVVVWASGEDRATPDGWHTNFRLDRDGDYLGVFDPAGQLVDGVAFSAQQADVSLGRLAAG